MRFSRLLLETTIMEMRKELVWLVAHQKREALFRSVRVREIQSCYSVIRWKKTLKSGYFFFHLQFVSRESKFRIFPNATCLYLGCAAIFCALHCSIFFSTEQRTMSNCKANSKECDTSSEKKMKRHKFCWLNVLLWFFFAAAAAASLLLFAPFLRLFGYLVFPTDATTESHTNWHCFFCVFLMRWKKMAFVQIYLYSLLGIFNTFFSLSFLLSHEIVVWNA